MDDDVNFLSLKAHQWWPVMDWLRGVGVQSVHVGVCAWRMRLYNSAGKPTASVPLPIPRDRWPAFVEWLTSIGLRVEERGEPRLHLYAIASAGCACPSASQVSYLHVVLGLLPQGVRAVTPPDLAVSQAWDRHPLWRRVWWVVANQRWRAFL